MLDLHTVTQRDEDMHGAEPFASAPSLASKPSWIRVNVSKANSTFSLLFPCLVCIILQARSAESRSFLT